MPLAYHYKQAIKHISQHFTTTRRTHTWPVWHNSSAFARDPKGHGFKSLLVCFQLGQAAHMHVPLSQNSTIWYRPMDGYTVQLGR